MDAGQDAKRSPIPWVLGVALVSGVLIAGFATEGSGGSSPDLLVSPTSAAPLDATVAPPDSSAPASTESGANVVAETQPDAAPSPTEAPTTMEAPTTGASPIPTTLPPTVPNPAPLANSSFPATAAVFDRLAGSNSGASLTVARGGEIAVAEASGPTVDGSTATSDTPMVVASVSKFLVALAIARLDEQGLLDVAAPVPWDGLGLNQADGWSDVTIREVLDHRSGVPKAQESWWSGTGTCRDHLPSLLASPPTSDRGTWVYSNGNYCLLGLVIEDATGQPLDVALQQLIFDPVGVSGVHETGDGLLPTDAPHWEGTDRLSMLGGAGTLVVSTDDIAMTVDRLTPHDREVLQPPGVFTDQYGFGHTGTITGAKACVWVLEDGATVVAATISGNSVGSGGDVCDMVVPAVASDLGIGSATPDRTP